MAVNAAALSAAVVGLAIIMNFSLHQLEEGHVGVYYRVSILIRFCICCTE